MSDRAAAFVRHDPAADGYAALLADVADAITGAMPPWRVTLGDAIAEWRARGVDTGVLERALTLAAAPDVRALLATFEAAVRRLAAFEAEAVALDPALAGAAVFRDPTRLSEAAALIAAKRTPAPRPNAPRADAEHWVLEWPDAADLLAGEFR